MCLGRQGGQSGGHPTAPHPEPRKGPPGATATPPARRAGRGQEESDASATCSSPSVGPSSGGRLEFAPAPRPAPSLLPVLGPAEWPPSPLLLPVPSCLASVSVPDAAGGPPLAGALLGGTGRLAVAGGRCRRQSWARGEARGGADTKGGREFVSTTPG
ncbi:sterile alpha motif domain-containing protein 1-like [Penaeus chinensis]|uniref:sterile alpha motif domain-containing protein 1-like n=1 Tax=Penaeus chinensis TaxID=139456 RepID=UPI001FB70BBC|nr:sterile alpha motif domain-containing protein 1-like [Penaeus chinensis]